MRPTAFTSSVTCAVRPAFKVVACAAVSFPAVTAASICLVSSATSAAISAFFFEPAIVANDSPASRRDFKVAASIPSVESTIASLFEFLNSPPFGPPFIPPRPSFI